MSTRRALLATTVAVLALTGGCATKGGTMDESQRPTSPTAPSVPVPASPTALTPTSPITPVSRPPLTPVPTTPEPSPSEGPPAPVSPVRWQAILDDLAGRGVTAPPVLVSATRMTWPNGALGCPKPGVMYTQALVDGLRVLVTADATSYDYRFGRGDVARLCER